MMKVNMSKVIFEKGIFKVIEKEGLFLIGISESVPMFKLTYTDGNKDKVYPKALKKLDEEVLIHENILFKLDVPEVAQVTEKYIKLCKEFNSSKVAYEKLNEIEKFIYLMHDFDTESLYNGVYFWATVNRCTSYEELITFRYSLAILFGNNNKDKTIIKMRDILTKAALFKETGTMSCSFNKLTTDYYKIRKDFLLKWYKEIQNKLLLN